MMSTGTPGLWQSGYLASAVYCILSLAGLSSQTTARLGNILGVAGVSTGIAAALGTLGFSPAVLAQVALMGTAGGALGTTIARRVQITDLPQLVALFHSFVGLAAVLTSAASYMVPHLNAAPGVEVVHKVDLQETIVFHLILIFT